MQGDLYIFIEYLFYAEAELFGKGSVFIYTDIRKGAIKMKMKKLCSFCLAVIFLFAVLPSGVFADAQTEQARVLAIVRERIGDTARYEHFDSSSRTLKNGVTAHVFDWYTEKDENQASLSVLCTSGGVITDYHMYDSAAERKQAKPTVNKLPTAEAMGKAKVLMDKLNPQLAGTLVLSDTSNTESLYESGYTFLVTRTENGIPFYGQTGYLRVNAAADAIESFFMNYDETLQVPQHGELISKAQAESTYAQLLSMKLEYRVYHKNRTRVIYPVYVPAAEPHMYVSATEYNKVLDMRSYNREDLFYAGSGTLNDSANKEESADIIFSEAEQAELEKVEGLLNSDAVLETILKNPILDIPEGLYVASRSRNKNIYAEQYTYTYRLESNKENTYASAHITADAKTGALLSYSTYRDFAADAEKKNTTEAAKAAAKTLAGDVFGVYRADESYVSENSVRYYRYVNDTVFKADNIFVTVHPESGKVTQYSITYTDAQFPSVEGVISPTLAAEKMFAQIDYAPYYMARYAADGKAEVCVVWVLDEEKPTAIEPFSGVLLNGYSNAPYAEDVWNGYTDIEGHYAQPQLETLARFGIRFADGACAPDSVITQADFIDFLTRAFYAAGTQDIEQAYARAESRGILTAAERADAAPVTRADAAKYLIRALGLEEIASLEGIYVCPFSDVTENIGHISILNAMGVVRGDGAGKFNPKASLTRADAAILIYNYLSR